LLAKPLEVFKQKQIPY